LPSAGVKGSMRAKGEEGRDGFDVNDRVVWNLGQVQAAAVASMACRSGFGPGGRFNPVWIGGILGR